MSEPRGALRRIAPWAGLLVALALVALAFALPRLVEWEVWARSPGAASPRGIPPLHGLWDPKPLGIATLAVVALALAGWRYGERLAERSSWPRLLLVAYVVALAWLVSLALVDGLDGIARAIGDDDEYLPTARAVDDVGALLDGYIDRIPISDRGWPTHVSGHPPLMLLFFVGLVRIGLGGDLAAGAVVTAIAASLPLAVLVTLRALGSEDVARRAAPFLVLSPAAVFLAVSADAVIATAAAWGLACLALAATRDRRAAVIGWSVLAGLLLGSSVLMSYGMPLLGLLASAVLLAARSWRPLPIAALAALAVVLLFAGLGFAWWDAFPVLRERYWAGLAKDRPASYWWWGNLAALLVASGPLVGAGLAHLVALGRNAPRAPRLLVGAAVLSIAAADASGMSKAEVERIWLPFMPWLLVSCALLPDRWRRPGLAIQVVAALLVQQLLFTSW